MIQRLSAGYTKTIALALFLIFYTELFCINHAFATTAVSIPFVSNNFYFKKTGLIAEKMAQSDGITAAAKERKIVSPALNNPSAGLAVKSGSNLFGSGPGQPEMQSFQSVNTNNMVDLFSGDFSYNVPLLDVGGYPVNLHYRSGISMDQEASWVGLGWNINPGTITRNMRGIPDDFNGDEKITKTLSIKKNWTAGATAGFSVEIFGYDATKALGIGINTSLFYNNYKGIGMSAGLSNSISGGMGAKGSFTAGISMTNNSQSGISLSPSFEVMEKSKKDSYNGTGFSVGGTYSTRGGLQALTVGVKGERKGKNDEKNIRQGSFQFAPITFAHQAYTPTIQIPFTNLYTSLSVKFGTALFGLHGNANIGGYYSQQYIAQKDRERKSPAYGYLYLQQNADNPDALLDFNREKELTYRESPATPHLAIPIYTHDIYSISGEGTGGMFRPYRSDIGYMHDQTVKSKNGSASLGLELGSGNLVHAGGNIEPSISVTQNNIWTGNNELQRVIPFKNSNGLNEAVYFKNPSEKAINTQEFYEKIADTDPVLPVLTADYDAQLTRQMQPYRKMQKDGNLKTFTAGTFKDARDKRSQVISYLTAEQAEKYALDRKIQFYPVNGVYANKCIIPPILRDINSERRVMADFRRKNHLSEITVLNNDGRRYVYGLPVYNKTQADVNFSVKKENANSSTGQVIYDEGQNSPNVDVKGTDNYYSREEMPAYAHSFMLTGVLSADYVDRLEDGITDDDQGDAVKFNYTKVFGNNNSDFFKWRTPFGFRTANYNEGLKTDYRDDKGSYIYGEKEILYVNSIESKTMIAVFTLNDPAIHVRKDGFPVLNEDGGRNTDITKTLRYLEKIDLYAKADLLKNGALAKPIKTVHFEYNYALCKNNPSSSDGEGKLTLQKVWFSYYNNEKAKLNPYVFYYHPVNLENRQNTTPDPAFNPVYNPKSYDRWGNFKSKADNPGALDNADYPYAVQDAAKANNNASPWTLTDIQLPSAGRLHVDYESDDYAYVQNKRAAQMTPITGFGTNSTLSTSSSLYDLVSGDKNYVFIKVPEPVSSKTEISRLYLEGIGKLYIRLRVKMPGDIYGSGYEQVTTYARIEDYGTTTDNHTIWIKLKTTDNLRFGGESPLAKTAIQTLRLNLPSKGYPGSDVGSTVSPEAVIRSMIGFTFNFTELFTDFQARARVAGWAKQADLANCFVRLDNPVYKKLGGGHRVKSVVLYDNWFNMTNQKESSYGQAYDYTTTKKIDGVDKIISSGVAAYEPTIGNEENPFHQPIEYDEQIATLAPVNNMYSEEPLGEAYFPGAGVGYSKVRVHSIHSGNIKSATGFEETEFYTSYDFPTVVDKTPLEERKYKTPWLAQPLKINVRRYLTQSQGFSVETNDMDGKMKATASYPENDPYNAISYTKFHYQADDDKPEQKHLNNSVSVADKSLKVTNGTAQIGKSIEMMVDFREQKSVTQGLVAEVNGDGFIFGIVPVTTVIPYGYPQYEENRYRSVATLKLIQRYGILDKVEHYEKGSKVTTENLLYDSETGEPLLTKVENEFKDPVYTFNYPAHWAYPGMGAAYKNIGAVFSGITLTDGKIDNASAYPGIENYFESGDEVILSDVALYKRNELVANCDGEIAACAGLTTIDDEAPKAWAIKPDKIQVRAGINDLRFVDRNGKLVTAKGKANAGIVMTILRSGSRNILTASAGSISSLVSPVRTVDNLPAALVFDAQTKVLNAAASSYKDFWKVEDAKYKPAGYQTSTNALQQIVLHPLPNTSFAIIDDLHLNRHSDDYHNYQPIIKSPYYEFSQQYADADFGKDGHVLESWLKFDFSAIPAGARITKAQLKLFPHLGAHNETRGRAGKNHAAGNPHEQVNGTADNEGEIRIDKNPLLNSIALNTLANNDANTKNLFLRTDYLGASADRALIRATNLQNGYTIDAQKLAQSVIDDPSRPGWLRLRGTDRNTSENRLCFWSTDNNNSTGCSIYEDGDPQNSQPSAERVIENNQQAAAASTTPCPTCSTVDAGTGNFGCSTTPTLVIEYLPLCANGLPPVEICGKYYCNSAVDPACQSYILDTTVNPYRFGILGNWRTDRAYTYFDKRKESDFTQPTNIRENGVVNDFTPFWLTGMTPTTDETKWVWNSQMTLFNRKGFEVENKDPLGRYNSVQYGYNQTLPVAVSQNARYAEQAFEGFEDADYDNTGCPQPCTVPRHLDIVDNLATKRTSDQAHTGKYSLQLAAAETIVSTLPVAAPSSLDIKDTLFYKIDTVKLFTKSVTPRGTGLLADYYFKDLKCPRTYGAYTATDYKYDIKPWGTPFKTVLDNKINFNYAGASNIINPATKTASCPVSGVSDNYFIRWRGFVQPTQTGYHTISATSDNAFRLFITVDGVEQLVVNNWPNDPIYGAGNTGKIYLKKGVLYHIRAEFSQGNGPHALSLIWHKPESNASEVFSTAFYPENYSAADSAGSVHVQDLGQCINPEGVRAKKQIVYKGFSPVQGTKYLLGAWVKEQAVNSLATDYSKVELRLSFYDKDNIAIGTQLICKPQGTIIEGWQRIEEFVTVPGNAVTARLSFVSLVQAGTSSGAVYIDDLRLHPFNANMKSYVYNPVDIKLMAELDENNFASFYEYDDEGTLIRVKKETERGIKTIKENRTALIKDNQ